MLKSIRVGIIGYGKAGKAVANIFSSDPRFELCWIARRTATATSHCYPGTTIPIISTEQTPFSHLFNQHPVEAIIDFSRPESIYLYGEEVRNRSIMLVSAISAYGPDELEYLRTLSSDTRVLCSPNITLGINFLIVAAKLLRKIAPLADVAILEQHFRDKPEVSGTARQIPEHWRLMTTTSPRYAWEGSSATTR